MSEKHVPAVVSIPVPLRLYAAAPPRTSEEKAPILLAMHGYGMVPLPMLGLAKRFTPRPFLIVAIQGPQSAYTAESSVEEPRIGFHFGVSPDAEDNRATHRAAVSAAIGWAADRGGDPARVSLAGFSHPCSFNYRLALNPPHGVPFRAIVAICGGVPGNWTDADPPGTPFSQVTPVLHISTRQDEWYPLEKSVTYKGRLAPRFAEVTHLFFDGGHRAPSDSFDAIRDFLARNG
ncbi:MAG: alpha/beta hydrolase [Acidithiobacillales bacterium]